MGPRRVVMVAMPCQEVVEVGGALDALYAAGQVLAAAGGADPGYLAEVVSPVVTVRAWTGLRLVAERSFRNVRGPIDTLIVTGIDGPEDARRSALAQRSERELRESGSAQERAAASARRRRWTRTARSS